MNRKTKNLTEAAIMIAISLILELIVLYKLPNGGSVTLSALPIIFFGLRHGMGWGAMAGFVFGGLNYVMGGSAIDWTTIIFDYFLAFSMLGLGAGVFKGRSAGAYGGTLLGIGLQFLASYLVGVFVWGKWMPEAFLGMTMTTPWFYSFLYNILWAGPDLLLCLVAFAFLYRVAPIRRYLLGEDLAR